LERDGLCRAVIIDIFEFFEFLRRVVVMVWRGLLTGVIFYLIIFPSWERRDTLLAVMVGVLSQIGLFMNFV
jgi:hypothetical protein